MSTPSSRTIRQQYFDFFKIRDHRFVPSWPLAPPEDPTLLFTNAGMNQFKDVFLGTGTRDYSRAVNSQKCLRVSGKHNDLEEVGRDTYHHTFFEMLGNWSFGDYFKKEAISWAWELLTGVWGLEPERLYTTVYVKDDESEALWREIPGTGPKDVLRFGEKDNFWEMGEIGPCGPCSEIHYDRGEGTCDLSDDPSHECWVNADCGRYQEVWNLVFIQYVRCSDGSLSRLPARHVDTGLGFERLVAILQGARNNYGTDLFTPLIGRIADLSGHDYQDDASGTPFRVMADHLRALAFTVADGILPSNEGRGYVLRRILRRAARYSRKLDFQEPVLHLLVADLVNIMGDIYPEIAQQQERVETVIRSEEESFGKTLDRGIEIFEETSSRFLARGETVIPANDVFILYDRYGFPVDLTVLMAEEKGMEVDQAGFNKEMDKKREDTRLASARPVMAVIEGGVAKPSVFTGHEKTEDEAELVSVENQNGRLSVQLDRTPFYAESGGQVGDRGTIAGPGFALKVEDTQYAGDRILHLCAPGQAGAAMPEAGVSVKARVDVERRLATARNHTATHLLQAALRQVLGTHVQQQSSLVAPDHLRFDFSHFKRLTDEEIQQIEEIVNEKIRANIAVGTDLVDLEKARQSGALAFFGEKYKDKVRVVQIPGFSAELCGGTHLRATGEIGLFRITQEGASAAGIRRLIAVSGRTAEELARHDSFTLRRIRDLLQSSQGEEEDKLNRLLEERKTLRKEASQASQSKVAGHVDQILERSVTVDGVRLAAGRVDCASLDALKSAGDGLRDGLGSGVGLLASVIDDKVMLVCVVTADLIKERRLRAGEIVSKVAPIVGGGGGGKPHMATAGGKDVSKIDDAITQAPDVLARFLSRE